MLNTCFLQFISKHLYLIDKQKPFHFSRGSAPDLRLRCMAIPFGFRPSVSPSLKEGETPLANPSIWLPSISDSDQRGKELCGISHANSNTRRSWASPTEWSPQYPSHQKWLRGQILQRPLFPRSFWLLRDAGLAILVLLLLGSSGLG